MIRATGPDEDDPVFANAANVLSDTEAREDMQTFVFSATLSKDLQNNLKRKQRVSKKGSKKATALGEFTCVCLDGCLLPRGPSGEA
jgi:hypothetical protein